MIRWAAYNKRFYESGGGCPQTVLCEFASASPAASAVAPAFIKPLGRCRQAERVRWTTYSGLNCFSVRESYAESDKSNTVQVDTDWKRLNYNIVLIFNFIFYVTVQ